MAGTALEGGFESEEIGPLERTEFG